MQWTVPPGVAQARVVERCRESLPEEQSRRQSAARIGMDGHIDFPNQRQCEYPVLGLPKPGCERGMKGL